MQRYARCTESGEYHLYSFCEVCEAQIGKAEEAVETFCGDCKKIEHDYPTLFSWISKVADKIKSNYKQEVSEAIYKRGR